MKLGLGLDLYRGARLEVPIEKIRRAESLGFHSVWTAEAYGSDALSPLAYIAALTSRIKLGTAVVQLAARPPATLAMHAMTIDALAGGGRVIIGVGVSGPQIVEGWYGQPWGKPNARLRDYLTIVRKVLDRKEPVSHDGPEISLPYRGPGSIGQGKPLKSILHPTPGIELWMASGGPKNTALAAELCDGWLPMFFSPKADGFYREALAEGFARPGARRTADTFEVACVVPMIVGDDIEACADLLRPTLALYVGGMGAKDKNFHKDVFSRLGYADACEKIQESYLAGRKDEAAGHVPTQMVEDVYLIGPKDKIRDDLDAWRESCVTQLLVSGPPFLLEEIAELVL